MKIVELVLDEEDELNGIEAISIVENPAIEENFLALKSDEIKLAEINKDKKIYTFTGRVLGSSSNTLDSTGFDTGEFRFPVFSKNDQVDIVIKNEAPFTSAFSSTEWEAFYYPKTKRV